MLDDDEEDLEDELLLGDDESLEVELLVDEDDDRAVEELLLEVYIDDVEPLKLELVVCRVDEAVGEEELPVRDSELDEEVLDGEELLEISGEEVDELLRAMLELKEGGGVVELELIVVVAVVVSTSCADVEDSYGDDACVIEDDVELSCAASGEVVGSTQLVDGTSAEVDKSGSSMLVDKSTMPDVSSLVFTGGMDEGLCWPWLGSSSMLDDIGLEGGGARELTLSIESTADDVADTRGDSDLL